MRHRAIARPFHGWIVVAALGIFGAAGVGFAGANVALFIRPISAELGWSAATFGWAVFVRLLMVLVAGPIIGRILDRRGPRLPVVVATAVAGGLTWWLSRVGAVWELLAIFVAMGLVGMGRANDLQASAPVAQWFVRRRGLAMGIALAGTPLGVAVYYPLTQFLIDRVGWRDALGVLAISGVLVVLPPALLLRRRPEDMGLAPDGDPARPDAPGPTRPAERSVTRGAAVRTKRFRLMLAGFTAMTYGLSTLTVFRVPHCIERGLDPGLVAAVIALDAVVAVAASVLLGRLIDRLRVGTVLAVGLGAGAFSAVGFIVVDGPLWLVAANVGYALGFQVTHVAQSVLWADRFGRAHQGAVRGLTIPVTVGIGATAFPVTGYLRDVTGTYTPAWAVAIALLMLAGLLLAAASRGADPRPRGSRPGTLGP